MQPACIRHTDLPGTSQLFADLAYHFDRVAHFYQHDPHDTESFERWVRAEFPLGRLGTVDEVADVACFLLSPRASWISGTNVVVDGAQNQPGMAGW